MSEERRSLENLINKLKQERDELALQIHLGREEAQEEWERLQKRLDQLNAEYEPVRRAVGETGENVISGLRLVGEEILAGFGRIRESLKK